MLFLFVAHGVLLRLLIFLMQTNYGDIEFGFFPTVAPKTVDHIFKLVRLGGYNTNHFFRVLFSWKQSKWALGIYEVGECSIALQVNGFEFNAQVDKGFVAQVADVMGGRSAPMNDEQRREAKKTVVGEFSDVKHVRGILSMGRLGLSWWW